MTTYRNARPSRAQRDPGTDAAMRARRAERANREAERTTTTTPDWDALAAELHTLPVGVAR
jgi:hypothetical protein